MSTPSSRRRPRPDSATIGAAKERLAEAFLIERGLCLLGRNLRYRGGELDLVMRDAQTLVFVEVRYRRSVQFGTAAATVDARKQQRLIQAAQQYLQQHPTTLACRFDVVAIDGQDAIQWIQQAFML